MGFSYSSKLGDGTGIGDDGFSYNPVTDTLDVGTLAANNVVVTALATPTVTSVAPTLTQVGTINVVAGASLVDGDYFTVDYGSGTIPIEFEATPPNGTTGGRIPFTFAAGDAAGTIRDGLIALINLAAPTKVVASIGGAASITVSMVTPGEAGGVITENVANAGFTVAGFANPTAATTYGYKVVSYLADGTSTAASTEVTTAAGHATLSASNYNTVVFAPSAGSTSTRLYRTTGGTAPPKLLYTGTATSFTDTGAAGTAQTPATTNTTGIVTAGALVYSGGANAGEVLTADANGRFTPQAGGGGITNAAGANVLPKSDGTNLVASALSEPGAGVVQIGTLDSNAVSTLQFTGADGSYTPSIGWGDSPDYARALRLRMGSSGQVFELNHYTAHFNFIAGAGTGGATIGFGAQNAAPDTFLRRRAAANPAWGEASATPVPYTHALAADASSADTSGANAVITPGVGRGNAPGSTLTISTPDPAAAGATVQTVTARLTLSEAGSVFAGNTQTQNLYTTVSDSYGLGVASRLWQNFYLSRATLGSKTKALTDGSATAFATFTIADGATYTGEVIYKVTMEEGAAGGLRQALAGRARFSAVRAGATITATVNEVGTQLLAAGSGTLTGSISIAGSAGVVTLSANFDTSQAGPDVFKIDYRFDSPDAALAITPL